jgi:hypothetical protein
MRQQPFLAMITPIDTGPVDPGYGVGIGGPGGPGGIGGPHPSHPIAPGGRPPGIWGGPPLYPDIGFPAPQPPPGQPSHPIAGQPPGIWGGPPLYPDIGGPAPQPPGYQPPVGGRPPEGGAGISQLPNMIWAYVPGQGWMWVQMPSYGGQPPRPDHSLPGQQPHPDHSLPGSQPHPDHGLPVHPSQPPTSPTQPAPQPPGVTNPIQPTTPQPKPA